jgi:hypothetical protein
MHACSHQESQGINTQTEADAALSPIALLPPLDQSDSTAIQDPFMPADSMAATMAAELQTSRLQSSAGTQHTGSDGSQFDTPVSQAWNLSSRPSLAGSITVVHPANNSAVEVGVQVALDAAELPTLLDVQAAGLSAARASGEVTLRVMFDDDNAPRMMSGANIQDPGGPNVSHSMPAAQGQGASTISGKSDAADRGQPATPFQMTTAPVPAAARPEISDDQTHGAATNCGNFLDGPSHASQPRAVSARIEHGTPDQHCMDAEDCSAGKAAWHRTPPSAVKKAAAERKLRRNDRILDQAIADTADAHSLEPVSCAANLRSIA